MCALLHSNMTVNQSLVSHKGQVLSSHTMGNVRHDGVMRSGKESVPGMEGGDGWAQILRRRVRMTIQFWYPIVVKEMGSNK